MISTGEPINLPSGEQLVHPGWDEGFRVAVLGDTCDAGGMKEIALSVDLYVCSLPSGKRMNQSIS